MSDKLGINKTELLKKLVSVAKKNAVSPISKFHVGAACLGKSGNIYLGVNLEFKGNPLAICIHAEQFMVINARLNGEEKIKEMALTAPPCGFCRQFLYEVDSDENLKISTPNFVGTLGDLLPAPFGPKDLGKSAGMLENKRLHQDFSGFSQRVKAVAASSYAPFTGSKAGVLIVTKSGEVFEGCSIETAAFNTSVSPIQTALVGLIASGHCYSNISKIIHFEYSDALIKHAKLTQMMISEISDEIELIFIEEPKRP